MGKILVDEILLDRIIGDLTLSEKVAPVWQEQYRYTSDILDLKTAIEKSNSGRYGVVEWHPVSERIGKGYDILLRFDNGNVSPALSDDLDYAIERGAIEWAHLPE